MCAIVDANVANEVFSLNQSPAGKEFYDWIDKKAGHLVVGGKLLEELEKGVPKFIELASELGAAGKMTTVNADQVKAREEEIKSECVSDDPHIIALAQISGARLLYTNDSELHKDFRDKKLIKQPDGKIYTTIQNKKFTNQNKKFTKSHKRLLGRKDLCQR